MPPRLISPDNPHSNENLSPAAAAPIQSARLWNRLPNDHL